jgi:hypothetical protein
MTFSLTEICFVIFDLSEEGPGDDCLTLSPNKHPKPEAAELEPRESKFSLTSIN